MSRVRPEIGTDDFTGARETPGKARPARAQDNGARRIRRLPYPYGTATIGEQARSPERADRFGRQSLVLALGYMLIALPVTVIVLKGFPGVAAILLMTLIWVIVGIINVAYAMRKHPQQ